MRRVLEKIGLGVGVGVRLLIGWRGLEVVEIVEGT